MPAKYRLAGASRKYKKKANPGRSSLTEKLVGRIYIRNTLENKNPISQELVNICARIDRAKNRLAVLKEVARERYFETEPLTATRIRKLMLPTHPLGLNHVLEALQFLEGHELVGVVDYTSKRELKIYDITNRGRTVLKQLCGE